VVRLICAWLIIQPWLIGGVYWWSEALNATVGLVCLVAALRLKENRRTLWRFPVFWLGLLFCGYVLCQAVNAWGYAVQRVPTALTYDLYKKDYISWLPSGVGGNYQQTSSWRTFVYWLAPWLLVCAWWAAVRRRRSGRIFSLVVFLNGIVMAAVVIYERFHPPTKILWFYSFPDLDPHSTQFASFVDHNKAAALLSLLMGTGFVVAGRLQARAQAQARDTGLTWVALFGCLIIFASFFSLGSRAGLAVACGVFVGGLVILILARLLAKDYSPGLWLGSLMLFAAVAGVGVFEFIHRDSGTWGRVVYLHEHPEEVDTREILRQETIHMIKARFWLGWGGGSYRYVSPNFFMEEVYAWHDTRFPDGLSVQSDWAHSDWLQLPMEFGMIGAGLLLAILFSLYGRALWLSRRLGAAGFAALLACAGTMAHAVVDFPMYNASILAVFSILLVSTVKNAELESRHESKS